MAQGDERKIHHACYTAPSRGENRLGGGCPTLMTNMVTGNSLMYEAIPLTFQKIAPAKKLLFNSFAESFTKPPVLLITGHQKLFILEDGYYFPAPKGS